MTDLFGNEILDQPKTSGRANGYSAPPGTGPTGETCKSCHHCIGMRWSAKKTFFKCLLVHKTWNHSYGTDIRLKSPACRNWTMIRAEDDAKLPLHQWDNTD